MSIWATTVTAELLPFGMWLVIFSSVHKTLRIRVLLSGIVACAVSTLAWIGLAGLFNTSVRWGDAAWVFELALVQMAAVGVGTILACYGPLWTQLPTLLLLCSITAPLAVQWLWRGGWLAVLGRTLNLGHGAIDLGGLSMTGLLIGIVALFTLLQLPRRTAPQRAVFANGGTGALMGALVLALGAGTIFTQHTNADWGDIVQAYQIRFGLASLVATIFVLAYGMFVTGKVNWIWQARAVLACILVCSAAAITLPLGLVVGLGLVCGLFVTIGDFVVNQVVRLYDDCAAVASILLPSVLGLLLVGLFADGSYGAGINGVGLDQYLHVPNLGVVGLWNTHADPGQLSAQLMAVSMLSGLALLTTGPAIWLVRTHLTAPLFAVTPEMPIVVEVPATSNNVAASLTAAESVTKLAHEAMPEIATADVLPDELMPRWPVASPLIEVTPTLTRANLENTFEVQPQLQPEKLQPTSDQQPAKTPAERAPNILERLRQANQRNRPEYPPARAARVAYPTRVAGRRLLRPQVEEKKDGQNSPPSEQ